MSKRPAVISLALNGRLKQALMRNPLPNLSDGACVGVDTEVFFSDSPNDIRLAKAICEGCPVKNMCLEWANAYAEFGIFGGLTPEERKESPGVAWQFDDLQEITDDFNFILNSTLNSISAKFDVDQRTAIRWRKILQNYQLAA
jgi:hypothetical protein